MLAYFVACQIPFLVGLAMVYITNNLELLQKIGIDFDADTVEFIGVAFFRRIFWIQGMGMGFLLMMIVGPGLISSDTANNALPLYLARPFTKWEYLLGKSFVLIQHRNPTLEPRNSRGWPVRNWRKAKIAL